MKKILTVGAIALLGLSLSACGAGTSSSTKNSSSKDASSSVASSSE